MSRIMLTTSPILCAARASDPILLFVALASVATVPISSLVCSSSRLISSIEVDNSVAAEAAISALSSVAFDTRTAFSASYEASLEEVNNTVAVATPEDELILITLAHSRQAAYWRHIARPRKWRQRVFR